MRRNTHIAAAVAAGIVTAMAPTSRTAWAPAITSA